jgi:hypothetical protein
VRAAATTTIDGAGDAFPRVVEYLFPTLRPSAPGEVSAVLEPSAVPEES